MQLIERKGNRFNLRIELLEDLWTLSQIISEGDILFSKTERKIKIGPENNPKQVKKLVYVELLASKSEFIQSQLRVLGTILNEQDFIPKGAHHTLGFQIGDSIEFEKKEILQYEEKLIESALSSKKGLNLLLLFDKEDLIVFEFSDRSFRVIFEQKGLGSKKYHEAEVDSNEQRYLLVKPLLEGDYSSIILAGPGFFKENFKDFLAKKGISTLIIFWGEVSVTTIQKLITHISKSKLIQDSRLTIESEMVSKLLLEIEKGGRAVYGEINTENAIISARVEILLITSDFIEKKREEGEYFNINKLMRDTENLGAQIHIIDSKHEAGHILKGLGGIAAILRY